LFRVGGGRPDRWLVVVLSVFCVTFLTACFGLDATNVIRPADRAAYEYFLVQPVAPGQIAYLLHLGPGDLPSSTPGTDPRHVTVNLYEVQPQGPPDPLEPPAREERRLTQAILNRSGSEAGDIPVYALWSPTSSYYAWQYGLDTREHFAAVRDAFRNAPDWSVAAQEGETVLFQHRGGVAA
jgi:hypothetical protein